jgi:hypothetical protein
MLEKSTHFVDIRALASNMAVVLGAVEFSTHLGMLLRLLKEIDSDQVVVRLNVLLTFCHLGN